LTAALIVAAPPAGAYADTVMAFSGVSRRCDYSETNFLGPVGMGRPLAVVRTNGSTVSADVQIATVLPNFPYDIRMIQVPRPSMATCWGGDPGVAHGILRTDAAGNGAVSLQDQIEPGATGAWIWITRPSAFSQNPEEFYTTDLVAPI
jgi:hypothetical protein